MKKNAILENFHSKNTHSFRVDGRTDREIEEMKEYGYIELDQFKGSWKNGYFCNTCKWFDRKSYTMPENQSEFDGYCKRFNFRDRTYGCCGGWTPK